MDIPAAGACRKIRAKEAQQVKARWQGSFPAARDRVSDAVRPQPDASQSAGRVFVDRIHHGRGEAGGHGWMGCLPRRSLPIPCLETRQQACRADAQRVGQFRQHRAGRVRLVRPTPCGSAARPAYPVWTQAKLEPEEAIRQADAVLNEAKRTGKSPAVLQRRRDRPQSVCGDGAG